ncbi:putative sodium-dependent multivitamin transporter [Rhipicephalus sanguineus]|uniref:putative sodium-dependent multivitamin transporter n=1 Tax=Rhipicephalus sanguineus TaxID=34632 RepID=UPI001893EB2B|nr:putative sodium-dependent multivitamin transporter [Rhipicephalus sanguineus]
MLSEEGLGIADILVFCVLTAAGYFVGLYFSFKGRRREISPDDTRGTSAVLEAFLGGRSIPAAALAVSVLASVATAVGVVSFVGHYYAYGFHLDWALAGIPVSAAIVSLIVVPLLYDLRVTSVFQYLRMRFDNKVGITACVVYFVLSQSVGAVGIFSSAIAVSTMFPIPVLYSNIVIGLAGTVYTALGGLRGVVWADCAQAFVMFLSPVVIIAKVLYDSSSVTPPLRPMSNANITDFAFRVNWDITTDENLWSGLAGALPFSLVRTGLDQMAVQRFMAARTLRDAKRIAIAGPLLVLFFFFLGECTAVAIMYWFRDCDPVMRGAIHSYDEIVPHYMMTRLVDVPMLRGLFLAGLVGASTSTISSIVNSHAAIFYIDVVTPYTKISDRKALVVMRLLAFASGTIMTLCAIAVPYLGTAARLYMSFYCSAAGPFAGLFLLALSSPWVNAKGVGNATLLVCAFLVWHAIGRSLSDVAPPPLLPKTLDRCPLSLNISGWTEDPSAGIDVQPVTSSSTFPLYMVSFYWISFIGFLLTIVLGTAFSLLTGGRRDAKRNLRLTSPAFLDFWKRFELIRRTFLLEDEETKHDATMLERKEEHCDDDYARLDKEMSPAYKGQWFAEQYSSLVRVS